LVKFDLLWLTCQLTSAHEIRNSHVPGRTETQLYGFDTITIFKYLMADDYFREGNGIFKTVLFLFLSRAVNHLAPVGEFAHNRLAGTLFEYQLAVYRSAETFKNWVSLNCHINLHLLNEIYEIHAAFAKEVGRFGRNGMKWPL